MKLSVKKIVEIEVAAIKCEMAVRYDEQDIPNDFPFRDGDMWVGVINIDTGIIRNWHVGISGNMYMKVCDEGTYTLLGIGDEVIIANENDYVPGCIPGEYGDYVEFNIDEKGQIARWVDFCTKDNVEASFFAKDF